jgi:hypothetical protein
MWLGLRRRKTKWLKLEAFNKKGQPLQSGWPFFEQPDLLVNIAHAQVLDFHVVVHAVV